MYTETQIKGIKGLRNHPVIMRTLFSLFSYISHGLWGIAVLFFYSCLFTNCLFLCSGSSPYSLFWPCLPIPYRFSMSSIFSSFYQLLRRLDKYSYSLDSLTLSINCLSLTKHGPSPHSKSLKASSDPESSNSTSPLSVNIMVCSFRSTMQPMTSPNCQALPKCSFPWCQRWT